MIVLLTRVDIVHLGEVQGEDQPATIHQSGDVGPKKQQTALRNSDQMTEEESERWREAWRNARVRIVLSRSEDELNRG